MKDSNSKLDTIKSSLVRNHALVIKHPLDFTSKELSDTIYVLNEKFKNIFHIKLNADLENVSLSDLLSMKLDSDFNDNLLNIITNSKLVLENSLSAFLIEISLSVWNEKNVNWLVANLKYLISHKFFSYYNNIFFYIEGTNVIPMLKNRIDSPFLFDTYLPIYFTHEEFEKYLSKKTNNISIADRHKLWNFSFGDKFLLDYLFRKYKKDDNFDTEDFINKFYEGKQNDIVFHVLCTIFRNIDNWACEQKKTLNCNYNSFYPILEYLLINFESIYDNNEFPGIKFIFKDEFLSKYKYFIKNIYFKGFNRIKKFKSIIDSSLDLEYLPFKSIEIYKSNIRDIEHSVFCNEADNFIIGTAKRINSKKIAIEGIFNFNSLVHFTFRNEFALKINSEAYFIQYDSLKGQSFCDFIRHVIFLEIE